MTTFWRKLKCLEYKHIEEKIAFVKEFDYLKAGRRIQSYILKKKCSSGYFNQPLSNIPHFGLFSSPTTKRNGDTTAATPI